MIIQKITIGFVIQEFDTDTQQWVNQDFIASDQCDYEVDGDPINLQDFVDRVVGKKEPYLPFDMVQPDGTQKPKAKKES
jgi:hypothetical protein